jgi:hypothetical protein
MGELSTNRFKYSNINSRLDATLIILLTFSITQHVLGDKVPPHPGHQQAASSVLYTKAVNTV